MKRCSVELSILILFKEYKLCCSFWCFIVELCQNFYECPLNLLQIPASFHAEWFVSAITSGSVWHSLTQLPSSAAPGAGQGPVQPGIPADLQHSAHSHPVRAPAGPGFRPGGLPAHWHTHPAGRTCSPAALLLWPDAGHQVLLTLGGSKLETLGGECSFNLISVN